MDKLKLFVIWLDGFMQACGPELNEVQTTMIKDKLNNLFEHEAETLEAPKLSLEEFGEQFGFPVHQGFPNQNIFPGRDSDGTLYRC